MKGSFPIEKFNTVRTPFYYYDTELLRKTLDTIKAETGKNDNYHVHYAVKANANRKLLRIISAAGFGADCVSGGEIKACLDAGFPAEKIVFAGVGKSDWEINVGLDAGIAYFNVESIPELEVINQLAGEKDKIARVSFRINPDVGAHTHANITTGLAENKFGIAMADMEKVIEIAASLKHVEFVGLHFHIGSQILEMGDFVALCNRVNELQAQLERHHITVKNINVGGGLGLPTSERSAGSPFCRLFPNLPQASESATGPTAPFRTGTGRRGAVWQPDYTCTLCQTSHIQAVCHRGRRHDRPHPPCPLSGFPFH